MLDLNTIFGMREQMLPQDGFLGFLLQNWLKIAIVVMILGFLIDQVLYVVRYRPQDKVVRIYKWVKKVWLRMSGKEPVPELEEVRLSAREVIEPAQMPTHTAADMPPADEDAPIIRRGGAKFTPSMRQSSPRLSRDLPAAYEDHDAPLIVRAPSGPLRKNLEDPDTHRGEMNKRSNL